MRIDHVPVLIVCRVKFAEKTNLLKICELFQGLKTVKMNQLRFNSLLVLWLLRFVNIFPLPFAAVKPQKQQQQKVVLTTFPNSYKKN